MDKPLFSVVTVTLNCADDAVATAYSVLAQDFVSYEYIVKDGGSIDGTVERLHGLGISVHVENDSGIYDAMNQAIPLCQGEYIYFLNAGDTFYDNSVLTIFSSFMADKDAIYYGNIYYLPIHKLRRHPPKLSRYFLFRKNLNHQTWMARRDIYSAFHGFDLAYKYGSDQDFLRRVVLKSGLSAKYIDVILANFVYGGRSTCKANRKSVVSERRKIIRKFYSIYEIFIYGLVGLHFMNPLKSFIWDILYSKCYRNI
jgi:putative colanic acid biosynthesis glycosyltransferase